MSFQRLRLRGWEVSDLYVAPLASLSDLLNNQPRRACVPICGLLHPSYIINTSNQVREWKKKKYFSLWSFRQNKGGGALRVVGSKDRNPSERREGQSGESDE